MDSARGAVGLVDKRVHISGLEFGQGAVAQDKRRQFMLFGQLRQHIHIGGIAGFLFRLFNRGGKASFSKRMCPSCWDDWILNLSLGQGVDIIFKELKLVVEGFGESVCSFS